VKQRRSDCVKEPEGGAGAIYIGEIWRVETRTIETFQITINQVYHNMRANLTIRGRSSSLAPLRQSIQLQKQLISVDQTTRSRRVYRHVTRAPQATTTLSSQPTEGSKRQPLPADTIIPKQKKIVFCVDGTKSAENALRWISKNVATKGKPCFSVSLSFPDILTSHWHSHCLPPSHHTSILAPPLQPKQETPFT